MDSWGLDPCPKIPRIPEAEEFLLAVFKEQFGGLLLQAAMDDTKRHNLRFVLLATPENLSKLLQWGGTVNYSKKERKFDFIEYSSRGYAKRIAL